MNKFAFHGLRDKAGEPQGGGAAVEEFNLDDKPAPDKGTPSGDKSAKGGDDDVAALRKQLAAEKKRNEELTQSERYWAEQAKRAAGAAPDPDDESDDEPPPADPAKDDPDEDDPAAFFEALTKKGPKALKAVLKKYGFVTIAEARAAAQELVDQGIGKATARLQSDADLLRQFPDLNDHQSPLFQKTAAIFKELIGEDKSLARNPKILAAAARAAKAELSVNGNGKRRTPEDDDEVDDHREADRRRRISAQGERGSNGPADFESDTEAVGPATMKIMEQMKLTPEARARAAKRIAQEKRSFLE